MSRFKLLAESAADPGGSIRTGNASSAAETQTSLRLRLASASHGAGPASLTRRDSNRDFTEAVSASDAELPAVPETQTARSVTRSAQPANCDRGSSAPSRYAVPECQCVAGPGGPGRTRRRRSDSESRSRLSR